MDAATIAQIASSASNVLLIIVFGYGYYKQWQVSQRSLTEMVNSRVSGGRPLVIVEADYQRLPEIDLVVRNVGGGPAKEIEFDFSSTVKSSTGFVLSDLFYLKNGMDFLGPGGEIRCLWDDLPSLESVLKDQGLYEGIGVDIRYRDMAGEQFTTSVITNPLLYEGIRNAYRRDMEDVANAVERIADHLTPGEQDRDQPISSESYEAAEEDESQSLPDQPSESEQSTADDER